MKRGFWTVMDRKLLLYVLSGLLAVLLVWQFVVAAVFERLDSLDRDIASRRATLEEIRRIEREYHERHREFKLLESLLEGRSRDYTPLSFLEELVSESGLNYELVFREPRPMEGEAGLMVSSVRVELDEISMDELTEFLYEIENSPELLRIRNLNIRPRGGLLRAGFEVATVVPSA